MKAFVVGNIAIDETFSVAQLPSEGESIFGTKVSTDLGGKGANQAIILARSGVPTVLIAGIGADSQANWMRSILADERMSLRLKVMPELESDRSIVVKNEAGENANITTIDCARSLEFEDIEQRMGDAVSGDLVVLQGNLKISTTRQVISNAQKRGMQIALNPSPFEIGIEALLTDVHTLFLNQHEALQVTGSQGERAVCSLLERGVETVVLSRGENGAILGAKAGIVSVPATASDLVDSTGAGDTLQGVALAVAALRNCSIDVRAIEIAAKAAALTVARFGTRMAFPTEAEILRLLET